MNSIRELYRIGNGPSSSHTMAPKRAAVQFISEYPAANSYRITLYGTLAATGKGHLTDEAIRKSNPGKEIKIIWKPEIELPEHPNGMRLEALDTSGTTIDSREEFSTGGGALLSDQKSLVSYSQKTLNNILDYCHERGEYFWQYVFNNEDPEFNHYLEKIWSIMTDSIDKGLVTEGKIPGNLHLSRKAPSIYRKKAILAASVYEDALIAAYAYAVAEENASGNLVVAAPTCGSAGVMPAVLFYLENKLQCGHKDITNALATAGLFGNIVKTNASISGAAVGCQGEIGTACAMAAAAATQLLGGSLKQIEYAAEMGLEHHLGLTCDPVDGLVQIPCIERNAHAAARAISCSHFALVSDGTHRISFDDAVAVMWETGQAMSSIYKETSTGGLATIYKKRIKEKL